jgi:hypothetical protein
MSYCNPAHIFSFVFPIWNYRSDNVPRLESGESRSPWLVANREPVFVRPAHLTRTVSHRFGYKWANAMHDERGWRTDTDARGIEPVELRESSLCAVELCPPTGTALDR